MTTEPNELDRQGNLNEAVDTMIMIAMIVMMTNHDIEAISVSDCRGSELDVLIHYRRQT